MSIAIAERERNHWITERRRQYDDVIAQLHEIDASGSEYWKKESEMQERRRELERE